MRKSLLFLLTLVVLTLPASAAEPAAAPGPNCQAVVPDVLSAEAVPEFLNAGLGGEEAPTSVCNAECDDGSYVSCWGTSCSAQDSACPGTRGSCWGSATGTRYCPVCTGPICSATASCANAGGGSVSCNSFGANDCFAIDDCYAYCDGTMTWCPNPPYPCPI